MSALAPLPVTTSPPNERIAYLDNARYWVMLLVVIGHSLTDLVVMPSARGVFLTVYLFHMPLFILISGYTARGYMGDYRQVRRMVSTLIVPYLAVELSLQLITQHYDNNPAQLMILSPQWVGWFLIALFVWRLTTPIWRALRYPITTSILISLLVPLIEVPNVLALPKILGFLPFYVIGLHMKKDWFLRLGDWRLRVASAVTLAVAYLICQFVVAPSDFPLQWTLYKQRYDEDPLNAGPIEGILTRAVLIAVALLLTFAALSLVPRRRSWTTTLGERTLYCYLLHGYVILFLDRQFDLWARIAPEGRIAVIGCIIGATIIANALMTKLVATLFRPIFEPRLNWAFRERPPAKKLIDAS